ncbi:MAG TPA: nuclear transport factor 2 family protein [Burkholderiales bacterium]
MITEIFATPQDAEQAFYKAFERADLAAMMSVWAEEEDIVCVHPGGARHTGVVEVRESWRQVLAQGPSLRFHLVGNRVFSGRMISIHSVYEHVTVAGESRPANPVLATNIYLLTDRGWRMLMHHASPLATAAPSKEPPPSVLH